MRKITYKNCIYLNALLILISSYWLRASEGKIDERKVDIAALRKIFDATLMPPVNSKQSGWDQSLLAKSQSCTDLFQAFTVAPGHHYYYHALKFRWYRSIEHSRRRISSVAVTSSGLRLLYEKIENIPCSIDGLGKHLKESYLKDIKDFIGVVRREEDKAEQRFKELLDRFSPQHKAQF